MASTEAIGLINLDHAQASGYDVSISGSVSRRVADSQEHETHEEHLPRPDGGTRAWLFLAGSFMIEALIWGRCCIPRGSARIILFLASNVKLDDVELSLLCLHLLTVFSGFPFSFGVFQEYYTTHAPFSKAPAGITIVGTSAMVRNGKSSRQVSVLRSNRVSCTLELP